ncbi:structural protein [Flavobacterium phage FLiP]|uniref:Structural protein n=1 Tax=Flavobacterium phage FLiP TaxID=2023716 RepID=A0A222NP92_9VIRU|nr:structural protein [Flavobacterium phage FLiP]ASQ41223.1 structural protein [Flavobacterium phage FLiP]
MAQRPRSKRFTGFRRFRPSFGRMRRTYSNYRQRRRTRRRTTTNRRNNMSKYIKFAVIGVIIFLIIKNKTKVLEFFKKLTGKKTA